MSKPRRPKYQRQAPKPAGMPAIEPAPSEAAPSPNEAAQEPVEPEAASSEAPAAFQDLSPAFIDPPAEVLPAPVEAIAEIMPVPAAAIASTSPRLLNAESFGTTVMNYFIGEGEAFAAHMRALAGARSMADFVRLQIGEFQRAADSTLTCWGMLTVSATRTVNAR